MGNLRIVLQSDYDLRLDRRIEQSDDLLYVLKPCPSDTLEIYAVSKIVNSPKNDEEGLVRPIPDSGRYG